MKKIYIILIAIMIQSSIVIAQDLHFSQFYASPMILNPATTGILDEDYRIICNYASQWGGFTTPYKTFAASYDMKMLSLRKGKDHIGFGFLLFNDVAGDSKLRTTQANVSFSIIKSLDRRGKHFISLGGQAGLAQRSINFADLQFDNQFNGYQYDQNSGSGESLTTTNFIYPDVASGIMWYYAPKRRHNIYLGGAIYHLNQPNQSFYYNGDDRLVLRQVIHGGGQFKLNAKMDLLPTFMVLKQGVAQEITGGGFMKYGAGTVGNRKKVAFYFGSWYRLNDAIIMGTKIDYGEVSFGFSYDFNVSDLSMVTNLNGGPEASFTYTGNLPEQLRKRKTNKTIFCPKFH